MAPREMLVALLAQREPPAGEPEDCDVLRVVAEGARDGNRCGLSKR